MKKSYIVNQKYPFFVLNEGRVKWAYQIILRIATLNFYMGTECFENKNSHFYDRMNTLYNLYYDRLYTILKEHNIDKIKR